MLGERIGFAKFAAIIFTILCFASNTFAQTQGTFNIGTTTCINAPCDDISWDASSPPAVILNVNNGANIEIIGSNPNCQINVGSANVVLNGVGARLLNRNFDSSPNITLVGSNTLSLGTGGGGTGSMIISGTGSLTTPSLSTATINGGTITVNGNVNGNLIVNGGTVTVTNNVSGNLTINGGTVNVTGNVTGSLNHIGGMYNNTPPYFGTVPATGLPDMRLTVLLLSVFILLSVFLWGCVIYGYVGRGKNIKVKNGA